MAERIEVDTDHYTKLMMVAVVARGILARYPFDTKEEMAPRYTQLALWLASLPDDPVT